MALAPILLGSIGPGGESSAGMRGVRFSREERWRPGPRSPFVTGAPWSHPWRRSGAGRTLTVFALPRPEIPSKFVPLRTMAVVGIVENPGDRAAGSWAHHEGQVASVIGS